MKRLRRSLNTLIVLSNIREAREELVRLEARLGDKRIKVSEKEAELEVGLGHALHHLNAAWNVRRWTMARYRKLKARDFRWLSRWPEDLWVVGKDSPTKGLRR